MSTFLSLAQDLRLEAGISSDGPSAVLNQTGEMKRVVSWITKAYELVQDAHTNWDFLRADFSFPTVIGVNAYTPASVTPALTEHASWKMDTFKCYLTSLGTVDERWLTYVPWDVWRDTFGFSANRTVPGRPTHFTVKPDKSLVTFPIADAIYTIAGEYWMRAQVMAADTDQPLFPPRYHSVVTWRGLMLYGAYEGAPEAYAHGDNEFKRVMGELETDQLPPITTAGALA